MFSRHCYCVCAGPNDVPSEKGGAGANGYTYFVCNQLGGALSRLPPVKPSHIKAARQVKKFVSGKLDAQVRMYRVFIEKVPESATQQ